jgi:hypothetical protein
MNSLILDKSSQDLFLRRYPHGNKILIFNCRCLSSSFNVALEPEQAVKSEQNSIDKRRWNATYSSNRNRPVHKAIFQRNNEWRFDLIYGK